MITVVLGGARSGKSAVAERLAAGASLRSGGAEPGGFGPVTYVATWVPDPADADMTARVAVHRARRPAHWELAEVTDGDLAGALRAGEGTVLVDALGMWLAAAAGFAVDADDLCAALTARTGDTIVVSEEVGLGVLPATDGARRFRDALGALNVAVASVADRVLLVVAGRVLDLGGVEIDDASPGPGRGGKVPAPPIAAVGEDG
jgi:adenosylcobinamide kinase/adenosylcobinamide-phosphate guanylyltransferase